MESIDTVLLTGLPNAIYANLNLKMAQLFISLNFPNPVLKVTIVSHREGTHRFIDAVRRQLSSPYTSEVVAADAKRDNIMGILIGAIKLAARSEVPEVREAGRRLLAILNGYRYDAKASYVAQTQLIKGLINDLSSDLAFPWLQLVKVVTILSELEVANNDFDTIYQKRLNERTDRPEHGMDTREQRNLVKADYAYIVQILNAEITLINSGQESDFDKVKLEKLVRDMNSLIGQYRLILANLHKKRTPGEDEQVEAAAEELVAARRRVAEAEVDHELWLAKQAAKAAEARRKMDAEAAARRAQSEAPLTREEQREAREAAILAREAAARSDQVEPGPVEDPTCGCAKEDGG